MTSIQIESMEQAAVTSRFDARWLRDRRFLRTGTAIMGGAMTRAPATAAPMDGHPMETAA